VSSPLTAVICSSPDRLVQARELAQSLKLPLFDSEQGQSLSGAVLLLGERVSLSNPELGAPLQADFCSPDILRRLHAGRKQPLGRACGLHKQSGLRILDCTAGLGQDMLILAAMGARVTPLERNDVIYLLLEDAFHHADGDPVVLQALSRCERPRRENALEFLGSTGEYWDVIYLDPMFSGYKRRALPKKNMQLLAAVCGGDEDADQLLALALRHANRRVVVKRSPQAPLLDNREPDLQIKGSRMRFDIYLVSA